MSVFVFNSANIYIAKWRKTTKQSNKLSITAAAGVDLTFFSNFQTCDIKSFEKSFDNNFFPSFFAAAGSVSAKERKTPEVFTATEGVLSASL